MARQTPCVWLLRARSRVSEVRLVAPTGVAADDASDRLLHSETVPTRALVLRRLPAQRPSPCDAFRRRPRTALVPEPRGSVPVHANVCSSRATSHVRRRAAQAPGGSGPPDANEAGEIRASRREPHLGDRTILTRRRFLPPCEIEDRAPLTPLSPPPSPRPGSLFFEHCARARRPPRPVLRGPRERRALCRSGVPSAGRREHAPRARRSANETELPSSKTRRSRDEDRRALMIRPPFAAGGLVRLRA